MLLSQFWYWKSEAFQAFSESKNSLVKLKNTKLAQALIVKAENGVINVKDNFDLIDSIGDGYFEADLIGSSIGI